MGGIVIGVNVEGEEVLIKNILRLIRNWLIIGAFAVLLMIFTLLSIYYSIGSRTVMQILAIVQFAIMVITLVHLRKLVKFRKQVLVR